MKVLITGGNGFIGSSVAHKLLKRGYEIGVLDNDSSFINKPKYHKAALEHRKKLFKNKISYILKGDIRNKSHVKRAFDEFQPNIVVHLAAIPMARPLPEFEEEMIPITLYGTLNVLEEFEKCESATKIVYTSSSMTYGHFTKSPQPEDVMLNPINSYGACKAAGEYFVKLSKKEWVIVRPTSVYGYADAANRVTQLLLDAALNNKSAWVVRGETLDFSYIEDVAEGFALAVERPSAVYQTFNISKGEPRSASDFAEILKKHFPKFTYDVKEPTVQQVFRGAQDITKAKDFLNFSPKFNIEDGIEDILRLVEEYNWKKDAY
jgi:nucleoside-diphosphate-sugar epimerase